MARFLVLSLLACLVVASADANSKGEGAQAGGDYQKYMSQYVGDYQKYMGGGQQGGSQQGGDYQKYMSQYAGDYQKYMQQGGSQQTAGAVDTASQQPQQLSAQQGGSQQGGSPQGGDYQKYMSQYAGDYQKYMGGGQQGGSQQGGDYQKYMSQYAGDYQKYMKQGGGEQTAGAVDAASQQPQQLSAQQGGSQQGGSPQGGDYQKYMSQYAGDYQKYMGGGQQGGSQQGGDYQKYMSQYAGDYQKYMKQGGGQQGGGALDAASQQPQQLIAEDDMGAAEAGSDAKKHETQGEGHDDKAEDKLAGSDGKESNQAKPASGPAWANHFLDRYAGNYMPQPKNSSDPKSWRDTFVKKYAGAYQNYVNAIDSLHEKFPDAPATATKCHTLKQLKEWRAAARKQLQTYIPKEYQVFSDSAVDQQYKDNKARIEKEIAEAKAKAAAAKANASEAEGHANSSDATDAAVKPDADEDAGELSPVLFAATPAASPEDGAAQDAGDDVPLPKTNDTKAWRNAFVKKFAGAYKKYVDGSDRQVAMDKDAPASPKDCHSLESLKRWRDAQHAQMNTFIPAPYRTFGAGAVDQEYAENKARIEREMAEAKAKAGEKDADSAKAKAGEQVADTTETKVSKNDEAAADVEHKSDDTKDDAAADVPKAEHKNDDKRDDTKADAPTADTDGKDTSAAVVPSVAAAATVGSSSFPLAACLAIAASVAGIAFAVARPRASHQDAFSEGLLAPEAPYVAVV